MYHSFLIHLSADGHLGCFHVPAIINSAVMNIGVHVSLSTLAKPTLNFLHPFDPHGNPMRPHYFFYLFILKNWHIVALQCCTTKGISLMYTYIPFLPLLTPPIWASLLIYPPMN